MLVPCISTLILLSDRFSLMETTLAFKPVSGAPVNVMTRFKAAGIHFVISLVIAVAVLILMLNVWYPQPYFEAVGGDELLFLIIGVDVTLGPLITLIIFDLKKKSLKFDLAVIAIIQILALCYGVYAMFQARPVYTVFVKNQFKVVTANEIEDEQLAKVKRPEFKTLPTAGPVVVGAVEPTDTKEREYLATGAMFGMDLQFFPQYYQVYSEVQAKVLAQARPLAALERYNPSGFKEIEAALVQMKKNPKNVLFLPCDSKRQKMTILLDAQTGKIVKIFPVRPAV